MDDRFDSASVSVLESEPPVEPPIPPKKLRKRWIMALILAGIVVAGLFVTALAGVGIGYFLFSQKDAEETLVTTVAAPIQEEAPIVPEDTPNYALRCLEQGYVCMTPSFAGADRITVTALEGRFRISNPGTTVYAPFDGELYLFWDSYNGKVQMATPLPDGENSLFLEFTAEGIQLLYAPDPGNPMVDTASVRVGDPIFTHSGSYLEVQVNLVPRPDVVFGSEFPAGTEFGLPIDFGDGILPFPTSIATATPILLTNSDLQLLQACLDQGYVCLPVPFEVTGLVSWYNGYEVEGYRAEYLGFDLEPGTVITAPFDGLVRKADGGGLVLKVKLPSGEEVGIKFYFQGYQDFEVLADDRTSVSAGDPLARFVRTIQWDQSSGVGPDFEYPGMLQIHLGDYNTPITPLVTWGTDGLRYLAADCRDTRSLVLFSPQHFQYLEELAKKGGFNLRVDPLLFPSGPVGEWISISDRCHGPVIANGKGVPEGYPVAMLIYETQDGEIRKILIDVSTMNYW